jgi:hypothetical protein
MVMLPLCTFNGMVAHCKYSFLLFTGEMLPFYQNLVEQFKWDVDQGLVDKLKASNDETLKTLDDKVKDAEENLGESEIRDALLARAEFFCRIGDKVPPPSYSFFLPHSLALHVFCLLFSHSLSAHLSCT